MKFIDLDELEDGSSIEADLCIVGSAPAGASVAKEFAGSKVQVLILEGGGLEQNAADQASMTSRMWAPFALRQVSFETERRGSSHTWAGRCASFNDIDFESRAWLSHSGWPINPVDIYPFLERSRKYLGIGPNINDNRLWKELGILTTPPEDRSGLFEVSILAVQQGRDAIPSSPPASRGRSPK